MEPGQQTEDKREKMQALSLAKECYSMKLDLLTNATVVDYAIRFVSSKLKDKAEPSSNNIKHNKESNGPDYDQDREEEQEEEAAETTTTNQVF
jgi:hypothetical protein